MKKILALALVMSVVAMAVPTFTNVYNGDSTWTVTLSTTETDVVGVNLYQIVSDGANFTIANGAWNAALSVASDVAGNNFALGTYGGSAAASSVATYATGTLLTFDVTAGAFGDTITILDYTVGGMTYATSGLQSGTSPSLSGVSTVLVPEPMTMALLGLGGLFVRRRNA